MGEHIFERGCLCESYPWSIKSDSNESGCEGTVCEHCVEIDNSHPLWRSVFSFSRQWICPYVVYAQNEGTCNSTSVCLYCILKAAKELGIKVE